MTTKLERLQRLRPLKDPYQNLDYKPSNLPYSTIDTTNMTPLNLPLKSAQNDGLSSRGLDNWNLNNNLKQFSETRQIGFFKNKKGNQRHKSNPYIIHKVRTPDIRTANRDRQDKSMEQTQGNFKKDHIHSHSTADQQKVSKLLLENVLAKYQKTNTAKLYPLSKGSTKVETKISLEEGCSIQQIYNNPMKTTTKSFRKNRFQVSNQNDLILTERLPESIGEAMIDPPQQCQQLQIDEFQARLQVKNHATRMASFQMKKRSLNKAIQSINRGFLSQMDNYFDYTFKAPSIQAEVQLQLNTISQPERSRSVNEKSSQSSEFFGQYDFHFEQERKTHVKSSKRKNKYRVAE